MTRESYWKELIEQRIKDYLMDDTGVLEDAKRYALEGGKRLRAMLTLAWCEYCGGKADDAIDLALAVELVHAASLVHDDLPCMDDAAERRGKPTLHEEFGEAIAVLTGDALLADALLIAAGVTWVERGVRIIADVSARMADAQAEELRGEMNIENIYEGKTAALIAASCELGALAAGEKRCDSETAWCFGRSLGLAYQYADDLVDGDGIASTPEGREIARQNAVESLLACGLPEFGDAEEWLESLPEAILKQMEGVAS